MADDLSPEARMWRHFERIRHAYLVRDEAMVVAELETLEQLQWEVEQQLLAGSSSRAPASSERAQGRRRALGPGPADVLPVPEDVGSSGPTGAVEGGRKGAADAPPAPGPGPTGPGRKARTRTEGADREGGREARKQPKAKERARDERAGQWQEFASGHREGEIVYGRVTKLMPFGAFVEVARGVEGLVHISEMAGHHVDVPEQVVTAGEELWVKIIGLDRDRRRVSLSIKQTADGGEVAKEYREYLGRHNYDDQGTYVGPAAEPDPAVEPDPVTPVAEPDIPVGDVDVPAPAREPDAPAAEPDVAAPEPAPPAGEPAEAEPEAPGAEA